MKNKIFGIIFGKDNKLSGMIALTITALIVLGCTCGKDFNFNTNSDGPRPANTSTTNSSNPFENDGPAPPPTSASKYDGDIRISIQDLADAVDAEDFTDFRETVSAPFKKQFSNEAFKTAFMTFIVQKDRVVPVLRSTASMTPIYSSGPSESREAGYKVLRATGSYPTSPSRTNFNVEYVNEGGKWKLLKIEVKFGN